MRRVVYFLPTAMIMALTGCGSCDDQIQTGNIEEIHIALSEIWNNGNVDLISEVYADDFVGHFPSETVYGPEGVLERLTAHRTAFPDWTEEVKDTIVDRGRVVMRFTDRGTNLGEFLGNPPTGNRVESSHVSIFRLSKGKIAEQWLYPDIIGMQRQLAQKEQH